MVINMSKSPKKTYFKKRAGPTSPVLSFKKGETEQDAKDRLKEAGWTNLDKVSYHVVDHNGVTQFHTGNKDDCTVCLKRGNRKVKSTKVTKDVKSKPKPKSKTSAKKAKK